jgi:large subunit ribosomal protein L22
MEVMAKLNRLRIAPRKMRLLADLVRGKRVALAQALLDFNLKKGALPLKKLLRSAVANAKQNFQLDEKNLIIARIIVDEGSKLKRWRARSRGRANRIEKKTSQIIVALKPIQGVAKQAKLPIASSKTAGSKEIKDPNIKIKRGKTFQSQKEAKVKSPGFNRGVFRRKSV